MSYVEAVRQYPPGPDDKGCGLETLVSGWVHHRDGEMIDVSQLRGKLTYCDRVGVTYMLPFGRVRPQDKSYWVFQLSGMGVRVVRSRRGPSQVGPLCRSKCSRAPRGAAANPRCLPRASAPQPASRRSSCDARRAGGHSRSPTRGTRARRCRRPISPALEGPRERAAFSADRVPDLQRLQPGYVVIGDSMAGTRLDDRRLVELTGVPVAPLLQPGSGPAFWYLALKNWVIASGIRPRMVFIFFRDANLTDVLFRLDDQFRWALDLAALDREDELNAVVARASASLHRVHQLVDASSAPSRRGGASSRP